MSDRLASTPALGAEPRTPMDHDPVISASEIFGELSRPMPAAVHAARGMLRGEAPDDELANTEAALASAFALEHSETLRYDYRRRAWMICERGIWREDHTGAALRALQGWAETRVFEMVTAATSKRDLAAVRTAARRALSARTLKALLELASAQVTVADAGDGWDPNNWLLATSDGTVIDLHTGDARPAQPSDRITLACGVPYEPSDRCEIFRGFVNAICDDDAELATLIQKAAGYTATGQTTEQKFIIGSGPGSNGKSTLLEILAYVLGGYSAVLPFSVLVRDRDVRSVPVEIARLPGRRFCRASELRSGVTLDEGRIKAITGEDTLMARGLYQAPFEFRSVAKLWLATNKLPKVDDRSHAFWRRAVVIPFRRTFDGATRDNNLAAKLRDEGPGILNWIIEGAIAWQRDGFPNVTVVNDARDDWRASQDVIAQWADTALIAAPHARLKASEAYQAFTAWASSEGLSERERPGSRSFGEWMADRFRRAKSKTGYHYEAKLQTVTGDDEIEPLRETPSPRTHEESFPNTRHTRHPSPPTATVGKVIRV